MSLEQQLIEDLRIEGSSLLEEAEILKEEIDENPYAEQSWLKRATVWLLKERLAELIRNKEIRIEEQP